MKTIIKTAAMLCMSILLSSCATEIVDTELFGNIDGSVMHSETQQTIQGVSIETTPATEVMLTDGSGKFKLTSVPTGSYQIRVSKSGYKKEVVTIMVRENRTTSARIVIEPNDEESTANEMVEATVTSWYQTGPADSSDVDIEYKVSNTSSKDPIGQFEVYFDIYTDKNTYYYEITSEKLDPQEQNFGEFKKFIRDATVDSVAVSGIWIKEPK